VTKNALTMNQYSYTLWPSLYDTKNPQSVTESWEEIVHRFAQHLASPSKDLAPGFGPYQLYPHQYRRRDEDVMHVTLATFDVDTPLSTHTSPSHWGMDKDVERCMDRLEDYQQLWYNTYSDSPQKTSFRLVLPLAQPCKPALWPALRLQLLEKFRIPADPKKCSGASHFYYMPSRPTEAERSYSPFSWGQVSGKILEYSTATLTPAKGFKQHATGPVSLPPEPTQPVNLMDIKAKLQKRYLSLSHKASRQDREKATLLKLLLEGAPLAKHGSRNESTARTAGVLAWCCPEYSVGTLMAIMRPSVDAMIEEGSSLTYSEVERMLASSLEKKLRSDETDRQFKLALKAWGDKNRGVVKP
jgi:hypothetical protein